MSLAAPTAGPTLATPRDGPSGKAVVAQITTDGDFDAVINAQGRSTGNADDWQARGLSFSSSGGGGSTP